MAADPSVSSDLIATAHRTAMPDRRRRTKAEMDALRQAVVDIAQANQPCTVRQIYYLGIGRYWDNDTGGNRKNYSDVTRLAGELREAGALPWEWIADNTRMVRRAVAYESASDALDNWAATYRRNWWSTQPRRVEVWCESDSVSGVIDDDVIRVGVGLYSCRGQASKTFVHEAALLYRDLRKPVTILYVGDWNPSGLAIPDAVSDRVERYGQGDVDLQLHRVAVTVDDVASGELTSHAVNQRDSNYRRFADHCRVMGLDPHTAVEVEAVPPDELRHRVRHAIEQCIDDWDAWRTLQNVERAERETFKQMSAQFNTHGGRGR